MRRKNHLLLHTQKVLFGVWWTPWGQSRRIMQGSWGTPTRHASKFWPYLESSVITVVQWLSRFRLFMTPWTAVCQASLSFSIFWSLIKLMSIELVMPSYHLILYDPLLLLPSIFPSIRVFSNEGGLLLSVLLSTTHSAFHVAGAWNIFVWWKNHHISIV